MNKPILLLCSLCSAVLADTDPLTLDHALSLALKHSPDLQASELDARAAEHAVNAAGRWTNPKLEFEAENLGNQSDFYDSAQYTLALAKSFQRGGGRAAEKKMAREALTASLLDGAEKRLALEAEVRKAFFELLAQQEIGKVRAEQEQLGRAFVDVAKRRLQTGGGSELEVVQAELELEEIMLQQTCCFGDQAAAREKLASLIGLKPDAMGDVAAPYFDLPALQGVQLDETRPALRRLAAVANQLRFEADRAAAADAADVTLAAGVRYQAESESESFVLGASMPLTFNRSGSLQRSALLARAEATEAQRREVRRRLASELAESMARYDGAGQEVDLITDRLIPKAEQAYTLSLEGYEVGRFSWIELIAAQQHLMDIRVRQIEALLNAHLIRADLLTFVQEGRAQ